jgi:hypothetical protein
VLLTAGMVRLLLVLNCCYFPSETLHNFSADSMIDYDLFGVEYSGEVSHSFLFV